MNDPLVSVVIPVYNGARYLPAALDSVLHQDYRSLEAIVVDDGSQDESAAVARCHPEVRYIRQAHQGVAAARNTGIRSSRGQFIAFLDQDDLWTPDKLRVQTGYLLGHPEAQYVLARQIGFLESGSATPAWLREQLLEKDQPGILPGTLVARRTAFDLVGMFDTTYVTSSDSDWFARAKDAGMPMVVLPNVLLRKRIHDTNQSRYVEIGRSEVVRLLAASIRRRRGRQSGDEPPAGESRDG